MGPARAAETSVLLGLGTNMGDRLRHLRRALFALATHPEIRVVAASRVYETEFVGEGTQDPYYNACVEVRTSLPPLVLLAVLKSAEEREGRPARGHLQPRPIDLDILLFGDRILASAGLAVPHKGMRDRAFVLEPLAEVAPDRIFPDSGETIAAACAKIRRKSGPWIRPLADAGLLPHGPVGPWRRDGTRERNKEDWRAALAVHCR
jgi:2-amino-4-hydroxy-6-hydroxymethyldihydropteridine diphosphokinase